MKRVAAGSEARRLRNVIECDRMCFTAESLELIVRDLSSVLGEYFHLIGKPKISVSAEGAVYRVVVEAKADALKAFGALPPASG